MKCCPSGRICGQRWLVNGVPLGGGDFDRRSAVRGDLLQAAAHARREHDDVLRAPGSAAAAGRLAERQRGAAVEIQPLQLAVGEEPHRSPVRRPERKRRVVAAGQRLRRDRVEVADPEQPLAQRIDRGEDERPAVRRDRRGPPKSPVSWNSMCSGGAISARTDERPSRSSASPRRRGWRRRPPARPAPRRAIPSAAATRSVQAAPASR